MRGEASIGIEGIASSRGARVAAIGAAAGFFSALFGVGGGIILVPLLIALLAYDARLATATSLAAIIVMASVGVLAHGALGNVEPEQALLVGVPAILGVQIGLWIKQRITTRLLTLAFAVLLIGVAALLAVGA